MLSALQCIASAVYVYVCVYFGIREAHCYACAECQQVQVPTCDVGEVTAEGLLECFSLKGLCLRSY